MGATEGERPAVTPAPLGDVYWFDIPQLIGGLAGVLTMTPDQFEAWKDGEEAAEMVRRITRVMAAVEARQSGRLRELTAQPADDGEEAAKFLDWLSDRFVNIHGESPDADFVQSLRQRARNIRSARTT
jgi:hypothetical protein